MDSSLPEFVTAYCTTSSVDEARTIAGILVREKLVACVNIVPAIESIYEWQAEVQVSPEAAMFMKTRSGCFTALVARIRQLHSYDCPCITAMPIVGISDDYAAWLREQTSL
ncbi:MAG: divalent-cation tolerance protein CutA [Planctomycetaceae bacterium]